MTTNSGKVAICLSGEMRGCDDYLRLLIERVYTPFIEWGFLVDLFVYTRLDQWWKPAGDLPSLRMVHVEKNVWQDPSDILSSFNPVDRGWFEGCPSNRRAFLYQSYLQYFRSLQEVAKLKRRAEEQDGERYKWVVRARPDAYLEQPLDLNCLKPHHIHFPENDRWPPPDRVSNTLSDKFAIGPSEAMDKYFDRRSLLKEYCASYALHAEAMVAWQMKRMALQWYIMPGLRVSRNEVNPYEHCFRPDRESP